jgi:hypothetical protein
MSNLRKQPAREVILRCRVDGKEVSLDELAAEVVRCGGMAPVGRRGTK